VRGSEPDSEKATLPPSGLIFGMLSSSAFEVRAIALPVTMSFVLLKVTFINNSYEPAALPLSSLRASLRNAPS
jgi:hypothetical protein